MFIGSDETKTEVRYRRDRRQSLRRFVRQSFIHSQDFRAPVGVLLDVLQDFLAGKHLFERVTFEHQLFPIFTELRVFADF